MEQNISGLKELKHSNYAIVDEQPDIQGWPVYDRQREKIGKVHDLLFDPSTSQVRYIIATLKEKVAGDSNNDQVIIPIGMAELHEKDDEVILPSVSSGQIGQFSPYPLTTGSADHNTAAGVGNRHQDNEQFDDTRLFKNRQTAGSGQEEVIPVIDEQLQVGKEQVRTGGIRLRSRIVETPVEQSVRLKEESLQVDRTPVDRPADQNAFREAELQAASYAEVPVVNKEPRVVEEISVNKEVTERDETISDSVRRTDVEIEDLGKDRSDMRDTGRSGL